MKHLVQLYSFSDLVFDNCEDIDFLVVKIEFFRVFAQVGNNFFTEQTMYCKD